MDATWMTLLFKPLLAVAFVAAYYFGIIVPIRWMRRRLPNHPVVEFLFRERGTDKAATLDEGVFEDVSVSDRQPPHDGSRPRRIAQSFDQD